MNDLIRGAFAGLAGTAAMSAAMAATRVAGPMRGETPPREIARRAEEALGLRDRLSRPAFEASWIALHLAYGVAAGSAYAIARRRLGLRDPVRDGALFGAALWALGYAGWLPAMGLYPPPTEDRHDRIAPMVLHHLIYGAVTSLVEHSLGDRPAAERPGAVIPV